MATLLVLLLISLVFAQNDPQRFRPFLERNRAVQCPSSPQARLPKSYNTPPAYYDAIPLNQRIPPGQRTVATVVPYCNKQLIQPPALEAYQFQTEKFITTSGLNIYDGSLWQMAMLILGDTGSAEVYRDTIIRAGKTCQFTNIRGNAQCQGVIVTGQCSDPEQTGKCGFCYGDGPNRTMARDNAWTFRSITDYFAFQGTIDARCPEQKKTWNWNDYKPVLGENSWAYMIGPLQVAMRKYGGVANIPANDVSIQMAMAMLPSLASMVVPSAWGAISYSPKNTLLDPTTDLGFEVSLENNISLLGGLKMLRHILQVKNIYGEWLPAINKYISSIETFARQAYVPSLGYFRQGGVVQKDGSFQWAIGETSFAVDCQTWTMSQLGPRLVDQWFGNGAAQLIWNKTKELGGYHYSAATGECDGLGFARNSNEQAHSGEWTFGAINMLKIFAAELGAPGFNEEAARLRNQIELKLTEESTIDGVRCRQIKYVNKRYYIPFGWWANPIGSLASTAWGVFLDSNWNPLHLGGGYTSQY